MATTSLRLPRLNERSRHGFVAPASRRRFGGPSIRPNRAGETPALLKARVSQYCFLAGSFFFRASPISMADCWNFFLTSTLFTRKTALASLLCKHSLLQGESGSRSDCANQARKGNAAPLRKVYRNVSKRGVPARPGRPAFFFARFSIGNRQWSRREIFWSVWQPVIPRRRRSPPRLAPAPGRWTHNRRTCTRSRVSRGTRPRGYPRPLPEFPSAPY